MEVLWLIGCGESSVSAGTVNSETMCDLLGQIPELKLSGPVTLVLDNARYQHCAVVIALAEILHLKLVFMPSYSPNLNLIERLWKVVKRDVLYGRYCKHISEFCGAIDSCLHNIPTRYLADLATLIPIYSQRFDQASFLIA